MVRRSAARIAALIAAASLGACLPLPFVSPPMEIAAAPGGALGQPPPPERWQGLGQPSVTTLQAAIFPMGLDPKLLNRQLDVGVGGVVDLGPQGALVYGPYVEARGFPHTWPAGLNERSLYRLAVFASAQALQDANLGWGTGFAVGIGLESATFVSGPFGATDPSGSVFGVAHGEVGAGIDLQVAARQLQDYHWIAIQLRVRGRLPGSAGLILIPFTY